MHETVFEWPEIIGCVEDMNFRTFYEHNSVRVWLDGKEIDPSKLKIVVYNDKEQD